MILRLYFLLYSRQSVRGDSAVGPASYQHHLPALRLQHQVRYILCTGGVPYILLCTVKRGNIEHRG
jgi:hypothetical protein